MFTQEELKAMLELVQTKLGEIIAVRAMAARPRSDDAELRAKTEQLQGLERKLIVSLGR